MNHLTTTPAELARLLAAEPALSLIDVRDPDEFAKVHAAPARNLPLPDLSTAALSLAGHRDHAAPIYLICQTDRRATAAAGRLAAAGFTQPIVVLGGTLAWVAAGLPIVRGE